MHLLHPDSPPHTTSSGSLQLQGGRPADISSPLCVIPPRACNRQLALLQSLKHKGASFSGGSWETEGLSEVLRQKPCQHQQQGSCWAGPGLRFGSHGRLSSSSLMDLLLAQMPNIPSARGSNARFSTAEAILLQWHGTAIREVPLRHTLTLGSRSDPWVRRRCRTWAPKLSLRRGTWCVQRGVHSMQVGATMLAAISKLSKDWKYPALCVPYHHCHHVGKIRLWLAPRLRRQGLWEEFTQGKLAGWVGTELRYKNVSVCCCALVKKDYPENSWSSISNRYLNTKRQTPL